jgi:hypothetical protein
MVLTFALLVQIILLGFPCMYAMSTLYGPRRSDIYGVYNGRLSGILEKVKGTIFIFFVWPTLWPLQGCHVQGYAKQNACGFHLYCNELWVFSKTLATRPDGYAGEEKGVIIVDKLRAILATDGGRF